MKPPEATGAASTCHCFLRQFPTSQKKVCKFALAHARAHTHASVIIGVFRGEALTHIKASRRQESRPNILNAVSAGEGNLS